MRDEAHLSSCHLGQGELAEGKANGSCTGGLPVVVSCVPGRAFAPTPLSGFRKAFRQEVGPPHRWGVWGVDGGSERKINIMNERVCREEEYWV